MMVALSGGLSGQTTYGGLTSWYHANTLAMVGAGSAISGDASDQMNPASINPDSRKFTFGFLAYPAGIRTSQISFTFPTRSGVTMFSARNVNYGVFDGFDSQGLSTGTYTGSDVLLSAAYNTYLVRPSLKAGLTAGYFTSRLDTYSSSLTIFTPGVLYSYSPFDITIGLSFQNMGAVLDGYTSVEEALPETYVLGIAKKLAHLPMVLCSDIGVLKHSQEYWVRLAGIITLTQNLQLRWGTSTQKIDQSTQIDLINDYLGSTGFGVSIKLESVDIDFGSYMFGSGGWIYGLGCEVRF